MKVDKNYYATGGVIYNAGIRVEQLFSITKPKIGIC